MVFLGEKSHLEMDDDFRGTPIYGNPHLDMSWTMVDIFYITLLMGTLQIALLRVQVGRSTERFTSICCGLPRVTWPGAYWNRLLEGNWRPIGFPSVFIGFKMLKDWFINLLTCSMFLFGRELRIWCSGSLAGFSNSEGEVLSRHR